MKKKKRRRRWLKNLIFLIIFLIGAGVYLYPMVSDIWNRYRNSKLITTYTETVQKMTKVEYDDVWAQAREYNAQHLVNTIVDVFDEDTEEYILSHPYDMLLNPSGNMIMGYIEIPKISVRLAIYHGIGPDALENGCGHVEGTSLPIGGESTHAVLSAHRGLPSAKLFTDLDQIVEGDEFYLTIMGEKLAYKVDQILTVLPSETEGLAIEQGADLVTLITCTPYGVNTHRMLVRGRRTELPAEEEIAEMEEEINILPEIDYNKLITIRVGCAALVVFLLMMILMGIRRRRKRRKQRQQKETEE